MILGDFVPGRILSPHLSSLYVHHIVNIHIEQLFCLWGILTLGGFYLAKSIAHAGGLGHDEYFDPKKDFELEREIILGKI